MVLAADRPRPHASSEANPFDDDKIAIRTHCPKCGDVDWFEWKFLGRLTDPICGHTWFASSGMYIFQQFRATIAAGSKYAKYLTANVRGEGAVLGKVAGWFMGITLGAAFRLTFAVFLIPIQALVGLVQPNKSRAEIITRAIVLIISTLVLIAIAYEYSATPGR